MASSEKALEEQLLEAGNRLLKPPASVIELLQLLDQVENYLSRVEQSPSKSMQTALCPSMKALIANELLRHSDMDVKVAVASCISEITRITAPDAPYDDEQMKEIFQLIVAAFEKLFDMSGQSYAKRVSILETVAKVRSCVVMLDLECDALIIEMFQHFLKAIREDHPENVVSSMETIMTLVLEESEDISPELLSPLLASVNKENQDVLPIARKLGEKVIENCAAKLKPYMMQAVQSTGNSLNDYYKIVSSICQETSDTVEHNDANTYVEHLADENKLAGRTASDEQQQVAKELSLEAVCPGAVNSALDKAPKSVTSNGTAQVVNNDSNFVPNSLKKKLERSRRASQSKSTEAATKAEADSEKVVKSETKSGQAGKKTRGRKANSLVGSAEVSNNSRIKSEKEAVEMPDSRKSRSKEADSAPLEGLSTKDAAVLSEQEKENQTQLSSPTASQNEAANNTSPSSQTHPAGTHPKRALRGPKKKGSASQDADPGSPSVPKEALSSDHADDETPPSATVNSKKESEGTSDIEAKPHRRSGKKAPSGNANERNSAPVDDTKKESAFSSDSETKFRKKPNKRADERNIHEDGSLVKEQEGKKKRGRGKSVSEDDIIEEPSSKKMVSSPKTVTKSSSKDQAHLEEKSRTKSKRKRTPGKEEASETPHNVKGHGEDLHGARIKVWWPRDHTFYNGVIESYDPVKRKHKVLYDDGDTEILNLSKERWEFIEDNEASDREQPMDLPSPDASEIHQKKKAKTNSESSTKHANADSSAKRGGGTTNKSKSETPKSSGKSRDDGKPNNKTKGATPKTVGKSKGDGGGKSKEDTSKFGSKLKDETQKSVGKSKDDTPKTGTKTKVETPKTNTKNKDETSKTSSKTKDETPKISSKSKGEGPKTGSKSSANGTSSKGKSGSSKVHVESAKGKLPDSAKGQESETKSGKKRGRKLNG
ncbi:PREDICTED: micronuclear linker histone polyprotein-like [Nelumbo nucifera]|uniref:Micronuclear linker histone polyprotein-like n=1 Tax=Nelumbo nucifera TaxID=4432 RepID=A0A1U8AIE0_NELNU|nr:PREDICTED: micronuclear linker histone polyprotein-like [Nelumbo nucifera]